MNRILCLLLVALLATAGLAAQKITPPKDAKIKPAAVKAATAAFEFVPVAPNAVFIDGNPMKVGTSRLLVELPLGTHTILVQAKGFADFNGTFDLNSDGRQTTLVLNRNGAAISSVTYPDPRPVFLAVNLSAPAAAATPVPTAVPTPTPVPNYAMKVSAQGPANAQVFINGKASGSIGQTFSLPAGTYTIRISAPGFVDFETTINLSANQDINAALQSLNYSLGFNVNVKGAEVWVNNNRMGTVDQVLSLPPNTYNIRISAPGFQDYNATINLNGNQTIQANLAYLTGVIKVDLGKLPFTVIIDGARQNPGTDTFVLSPGTHSVRIEYLQLAAQTSVTVLAGQTVTVSLNLGIMVK